uniref:very short patch repair endonuclease n=1 Tax=Catellatospora paridis TaxID=1617086 RepID=UPI0012D3BD5B
MSRQRARDTGIEVSVRQELHRMGLRFRIHRRPLQGVRREADLIFTRVKVAVFVDGCFWHGCPDHATWPKNNEQFWRTKIEGNRARDVDTDARLAAAGWLTVRIWEHEKAVDAALRVAATVRDRRGHDRPGLRHGVGGVS